MHPLVPTVVGGCAASMIPAHPGFRRPRLEDHGHNFLSLIPKATQGALSSAAACVSPVD
jgi:hypothetical protein